MTKIIITVNWRHDCLLLLVDFNSELFNFKCMEDFKIQFGNFEDVVMVSEPRNLEETQWHCQHFNHVSRKVEIHF